MTLRLAPLLILLALRKPLFAKRGTELRGLPKALAMPPPDQAEPVEWSEAKDPETGLLLYAARPVRGAAVAIELQTLQGLYRVVLPPTAFDSSWREFGQQYAIPVAQEIARWLLREGHNTPDPAIGEWTLPPDSLL